MKPNVEQEDPRIGVQKFDLSASSQMVYQLASGLPDPHGNYILYVDNFFNNIKLAMVLKQKGIAICGTAKQGSGFSEDLLHLRPCFTKKGDRAKKSIDVVCKPGNDVDDVLCLAWSNNAGVQIMITGQSPEQVIQEVVFMDSNKQSGINYFGNCVAYR